MSPGTGTDGFPGWSHLGDRISAWVDGELSGSELQAAAAHLDQCDHCRAVVRSEQRVREWIRLLPQEDPPEGFLEELLLRGPRDRIREHRRVRFGVANLVASAAVWMLVLGVGRLSSNPSVTPPITGFVSTHEANVATSASFGSVNRQLRGTGSDLPAATVRFDLVAFRTESGVTEAVYSDGVHAVSVFRQVGTLDWGAVERGREVRVGSDRGLVVVGPTATEAEVLLFERGDYVYAVVAPPESGVIDEIAVAMPVSPGDSLWDRANAAGQGLLDCFGFRG